MLSAAGRSEYWVGSWEYLCTTFNRDAWGWIASVQANEVETHVVDDDFPTADAQKVTGPAPIPPRRELLRTPEERADYVDLYRTQARSLVAFLMTIGAGPEEAWDAAHTAFIRAWERWPSLGLVLAQKKAWLRTTAYRAYLRSAPAADRHRSNEPVPDRPDVALGPEDLAVLEQDNARIRAVFGRLPTLQRLHLAWHLDGYTYAEIAKHTGKKETAVRQNVSRAIRTLREVAKDDER